jgi:hypothetical protein
MRPEVSSTLDAYIDLHRHAGIRAKLVEDNRASIQRTKRRGTLTYDSDRKNVWYLVRERLKRMQEIRCKSTL